MPQLVPPTPAKTPACLVVKRQPKVGLPPMELADLLFPEHAESTPARQYRCPACASENVHIEDPHVTAPDYSPTRLLDFRGPEIQIPMWCESGHQWHFVLAFHKGRLFTAEVNVRRRRQEAA